MAAGIPTATTFERTTPRLVEPDTEDNLQRQFLENQWTDALLGRQHDRQPVSPVVLEELPLQAFFGVGLEETRRGALECGHAQPFSTVVRPAITSCITGTPVTGSLPRT